jgi:hypothetical protein
MADQELSRVNKDITALLGLNVAPRSLARHPFFVAQVAGRFVPET